MSPAAQAALGALAPQAGEETELSERLRIDHERVDRFATATGDEEWIHVDRERAPASPSGCTTPWIVPTSVRP